MDDNNNIGGTNNLALASLILSIAFVVLGPLGSIPGIICGHMALKDYRRIGVTQGIGIAKTGLWIGYIGLIISIVVVVLTLILYIFIGSENVIDQIDISPL